VAYVCYSSSLPVVYRWQMQKPIDTSSLLECVWNEGNSQSSGEHRSYQVLG
jgi:hypothetical protein